MMIVPRRRRSPARSPALPRTTTTPPRIAAAYRIFGEAGRRIADELAVHDRQAPVTSFPQSLGDLPAVAEIAQGIAELERLLACKPRVTGGSGAGEHALRYPGLQLLLQFGRGDREQQHT